MSGVRLEGLVQPDARSCGAACVVAAGLVTGARPPLATAGWASEVLATHRRLTSCRGADDRLQAPWPRALGTPPWAVARALAVATGRRYRTRPACDRAAAYSLLGARASRQAPVAAYVGNRWLPRHVVLVLSAGPGSAEVYEPSSGRVLRVARERWVEGPLALAGWDRTWLVVAPA